MLKFNGNSKTCECSLEATGTTKDIMIEVCMVINSLYSTMHKQDRLLAEVFRKEIQSLVGDPGSPLWELEAIRGTGIMMTMPIKREDDDNG